MLAFILESIHQVTPTPEKAVLVVDGQEVPVNAFVTSMLAGMLRGFVSSLKGADASGKIEVRLG